MPNDCDGIRYVLVPDLIAINRWLIETQTPDEPIAVLKPTELASAQQKPANYRYYEQTDDMIVLTAVLIAGIIGNHPFANANKRTAAAAATVFLMINGWQLTAPDSHLVVEIHEFLQGSDSYADRFEYLQDWLAHWTTPRDATENLFSDAFVRMVDHLGIPLDYPS
ncbi:type II toxin-antitoxin system death-on-curing family toxin [Pseudomonas oryzihabitans]|uniref:type II toxin-antitoxin system death-on-curing family toxin n=1 Tax=Pseudomonas oryzihabitans TaxID=47885 RepID=UPI00241C4724|nr:type II toxin-antitoxin system death-on-curing family toxin [Pseudomonas oryzihabitans]